MIPLDASNTAGHLRDAGRVPPDARVAVRELAGGVSNVVLRVDVEGSDPFVVKQCREKLRVAMDWRARLDRIWAEHAALGVLGEILPEGAVPRVLWEDRPNYLFAMTCAPDAAVTWKSRLMAGEYDPATAQEVGRLLGLVHARGASHPALRSTLADASLFDELRVDPYYRTIARVHPDLAPAIHTLIDGMNTLPIEERTLTLGDYSPKNILVHPGGGPILLDFECAHAGDPAFDLGFLLSHLMLKAIRARMGEAARGDRPAFAGRPEDGEKHPIHMAIRFWDGYREATGVEADDPIVARAARHLGACVLARVDGKSPVEYLDAPAQGAARHFARALLTGPPLREPHLAPRLLKMILRDPSAR